MIKKVHFCFSIFSNFYAEDNLMIVMKRTCSILIIALVLGVSAGCSLDTGDIENGDYSYNIDELAEGIFYSPSQTMTMNEWFLMVLNPPISYDAWSQQSGLQIFMDKELKTPFDGSDTINENTVFYTDFPLNNYGKKIGVITGTITLTGIPSPVPKVWINNDSYYWWFTGRVNMSNVNSTTTTATLNWSMPIYGQGSEEWGFRPNTRNQFELFVLADDGKYGYKVSVPTVKTIGNANTNVGSLGTVSIKCITLSGTINVTYNGEPVPHVEIYANYPVKGPLNKVFLSSPEQDAPWSIILVSSNTPRDIEFHIFGATRSDWTTSDMLFDIMYQMEPVYVADEDIPGIVIDLGEVGY